MTPLENAAAILRDLIEEVAPRFIISMVSGGRDSAASDAVVRECGIKVDAVIHGNTRTGIQATTAWVQEHYDPLVADAGTAYEDYIFRKGFFGKGQAAHGFSYRVLKATPFRKVISREFRQRRRGVRILLINGARKDESANRKAHLQIMRADPAAPGNIWVNPIHNWSQDDRDNYLDSRSIPINPVAKALCKSGECMCGTTQSRAERVEASVLYPEWGRWIDSLEAEARRRHGFGWGEPFPRARRGQGDLFQPMCEDCVGRVSVPQAES